MRLFISGATATLSRHLDRDRLGLLLVPDSGNSPATASALGLPWAADNAAFSGFRPAAYCGLLARIARHPNCRFVACPDVVGDAAQTLTLFDIWEPILRSLGLPVALVGQDGLESWPVPWDRIDALFLGGSTEWKLGEAAAALARQAKARGKWLHMGRVNTRLRLRYAFHLGCDSIDGSGFSRWPEQRIPAGLRWLAAEDGRSPSPGGGAGELFTGGDPFATRGWQVVHARQENTGYEVTVRVRAKSDECEHCGDRRRPHRHGVRPRRLVDAPRGRVPVRLICLVERVRCRGCGRVWSSAVAGVSSGNGFTDLLADWIVQAVRTSPGSSVALNVGISVRTLNRWLRLARLTAPE